jgi:uncharacterized protein (DUF488 family)
MTAFDLLTIGHSNIPADRFIALLRGAGVDAVADVRSVPASRFFPWFSARKLAPLLEREGMSYLRYGDELGGRPREQSLYRNGIVDYEATMRQPEFQSGIQRLLADASRCRVCVMCAEREPLDCHRCLLLARALTTRGLGVGHILHDGGIEPHAATERRLLALDGAGQEHDDLFATGQNERLAAAYRRRAQAVGHRVVGHRVKPARGSATPRRSENSH